MFVHISKVQNKVKCPASASAGPGAGIGCNVMVRTKIQNTELQNTKDTNVPFNWPGSSAQAQAAGTVLKAERTKGEWEEDSWPHQAHCPMCIVTSYCPMFSTFTILQTTA